MQLGYYVPIGDHAAFWPVLRGSYGASRDTLENGSTSVETKQQVFEVSLTPQFLLRPTKSFFVRFAPGVIAYRATETKIAPLGAIGIVNGWSPTFSAGVGLML